MTPSPIVAAEAVRKVNSLKHPATPGPAPGEALQHRYRLVRRFSESLCLSLQPEDYVLQTMPEMSPTKWHLAHTTWFFETFLLKPHQPNFRPFNSQYAYLFNSYYNAAGQMHPRGQRGLLSRPTVQETYLYRRQVDEALSQLLGSADQAQLELLEPLLTLGLNHEQQHQELLLTDIKHAFWTNPLRPCFRKQKTPAQAACLPLQWRSYKEGLFVVGHDEKDFCFDNERPRHRVFLQPYRLANRLVTNGEFLAFLQDGGYQRPEFWLSLGWNTLAERRWQAPLYWEQRQGQWWQFTLAGMQPLALEEPLCHISYFEADAFARWAGARLPSEAEWEVAARDVRLEGAFVEAGLLHPQPAQSEGPAEGLLQMFGQLWQWTQSAYSPYPGYHIAPGALGEYNGKFMCNQYVLRGASCATARSHARRTYRNFFPPEARWQFSGIRLANSPQ